MSTAPAVSPVMIRLAAPAATLGVVLVVLAVVVDLPPLRMALAVLICLLLPGLGWARRFGLKDRGDTLALAVVLSICATVAVATAMAVSGLWSTLAGLLVLVGISVLGFVPTRQLLTRLGAVLPVHDEAGGAEWVDWYAERRRAGDEARQQAEEAWVDWYAEARRREAEGRARTAALAREAEAQWAEWYRSAHPERVGARRR